MVECSIHGPAHEPYQCPGPDTLNRNMTEIEFAAVIELLQRAHSVIGVVQDDLPKTYIEAALRIMGANDGR